MSEHKVTWIAWQHHRRTEVLSKQLNAKLVVFTYSGASLMRYLILTLNTIAEIIKNLPKLLIVQNPSIILAFIVSVFKPLFGYRLIIDRHSNFKLETQSSFSLKWRLFHWISHYTIKAADLTIVTNDFLKQYVDNKGGYGFVLQDMIPSFSGVKLACEPNKAVFISTFGDDECFANFIQAADIFAGKYIFYITGDYKKAVKRGRVDLNTLPTNVKLAGFLSDHDYLELLGTALFVVDITINEYTLSCGAYEAIALGKPMILGNTKTVKEYFSKGTVYTDGTVKSFRECIGTIVDQIDNYREEVVLLRADLQKDWDGRFHNLLSIIRQWGIEMRKWNIWPRPDSEKQVIIDNN